jgi:hypothetical protein
MTYAPALPLGGYAGWAFLKRTMPTQTAAFNSSPDLKQDEGYFRAKIGQVTNAEQLVGDRRLLKVALGAFGLDNDINNKFFIRKVLEDGTLNTGALANRLADKQYQKLSAAFGFGDFAVPSTKLSDFPEKILTAYRARQFEIAVGEQNSDLRLALNVQRELHGIAAKTSSSENSKWFTVMGNAPMRKVFEKALGLPTSLGVLDLDKQLETFKAKAKSQLGSDAMAQFTDPTKVEGLVRRFLLRSETEGFAQSGSNNAALQLMQSAAASARYRFR